MKHLFIFVLIFAACVATGSVVQAASEFDIRARKALIDCIQNDLADKTASTAFPIRTLAKTDYELALNHRLVGKFPRLAFMLRDPDEFIHIMRERFALQKRLTPDKPYQFDYTEIGIPIIKDMRDSLVRRIKELEGIQEQLIRAGQSPTSIKRVLARNKKLKPVEIKTALAYLRDLAKEGEGYLAKGSVSYQNTIEFASFYARVIGHFQARDASFFARLMLKTDRYLDGYRQHSIDEEYRMYQNRDFWIFQPGLRVGGKGFRISADAYQDAVTDPQELKVILIPTADELDEDILLRLLSRPSIGLVGVTHDPILADGILRPGGDFWNHDTRHESAKYVKWLNYIRQKQLDYRGQRELQRHMDGWYYKLDAAVQEIPDKDLREAVKLLTFSLHHDRGFPMIPSVYLSWKRDPLLLTLYAAMKASGQDVHFARPFENYRKADKWLRTFWKLHQEEEAEFLQAYSHDQHIDVQ